MATILRKIAEQVLSRTAFSNLAMDRARDAAVDTIGCMIAGRGDESVAALTRAFDGEIVGGGEARLVTGGSDYHGPGSGRSAALGRVGLPRADYARLADRLAERGAAR